MITIILGIFFLVLGIWGIIFIRKNRKNMPAAVFGISRAKYEIINKEKFNNVMLEQSCIISIYSIIIGSFFILTKNSNLISLAGCIIFINVIFGFIAKKHIKIFL